MLQLEKISSDTFAGRPGPLLLIVMDGVGIGKQDGSNAVYVAKTPTLDKLFGAKLYCQLQKNRSQSQLDWNQHSIFRQSIQKVSPIRTAAI